MLRSVSSHRFHVVVTSLAVVFALLSANAMFAAGRSDPPVDQRAATGTVVAWGDNYSGQTNVPTAAQTGVVQVAAGGYHSLALKSDGSIVAWGNNLHGQTSVPAAVQTGVVQVTGSDALSMAIRVASDVSAWGFNSHGQAETSGDLNGTIQIAAGSDHNLALKSDGTVIAWGKDNYGQATVPIDLSGVIQVAAGGVHSLALKSDGTVVAWGYNNDGQTDVPADLSGVVQIATRGDHNLALKNDGTVVAWGFNNYGQATVPTDLNDVIQVAGGGLHSLALKSDGTVVAWGFNNYGQTTVPANLDNVVQIAGGTYHSLALKSDGSVVAWGDDYYDQSIVPSDLSDVVQIAGGVFHNLALKSDGSVIAWGQNAFDKTIVPAGRTGIVQAAGGTHHSLLLHGPLPPTISSAAPSGGVYGTAYSHNFSAEGTPPFEFSVSAGSLPPGLSLSSDGLLSGTPTQAGSFGPITVQASNAVGSDTQEFSLSIDPATLTVTADPKAKVYGADLPALTYQATGFIDGEDESILTGALATAATTSSPVGNYAITQGTLAAPNYSINFTGAELTIEPATLNITANAQSKVYGAALPALSYSAGGFVNDEDESIITGMLATDATTTSPVGTYSISVGELAAPNYAITFTGAALTVEPAELIVTADDQTMLAGDAMPKLTLRYSGFIGDEGPAVLTEAPVAHCDAGSSAAGAYPINVSGGQAANYRFVYVPGTLTVTPAAEQHQVFLPMVVRAMP